MDVCVSIEMSPEVVKSCVHGLCCLVGLLCCLTGVVSLLRKI